MAATPDRGVLPVRDMQPRIGEVYIADAPLISSILLTEKGNCPQDDRES